MEEEKNRGRRKLEVREWEMWHIRVPRYLGLRLEKYLAESPFVSKSEFVRDAVREKLEIVDEAEEG